MSELDLDELTEVTAKIRTRMAGSFVTTENAYVVVMPSDTGERAVAMLVIGMADGETPLQAAEALLRNLGDDEIITPRNLI
jgi:hypothetical protein